jgi:hypothetical protein
MNPSDVQSAMKIAIDKGKLQPARAGETNEDKWPWQHFTFRRVIFLHDFELWMATVDTCPIIMDHIYWYARMAMAACYTIRGMHITNCHIYDTTEITMGGHNTKGDLTNGILPATILFDNVEFENHASFFDALWYGPVRFSSCSFHGGTLKLSDSSSQSHHPLTHWLSSYGGSRY